MQRLMYNYPEHQTEDDRECWLNSAIDYACQAAKQNIGPLGGIRRHDLSE